VLKVRLQTKFKKPILKSTGSGYRAEIQQNTKQGAKSTEISR